MGGYKKGLYPDIWKEVTMSVVFAGKEQGPCLYHEGFPTMQQRIYSVNTFEIFLNPNCNNIINYVRCWYHWSSKYVTTCVFTKLFMNAHIIHWRITSILQLETGLILKICYIERSLGKPLLNMAFSTFSTTKQQPAVYQSMERKTFSKFRPFSLSSSP